MVTVRRPPQRHGLRGWRRGSRARSCRLIPRRVGTNSTLAPNCSTSSRDIVSPVASHGPDQRRTRPWIEHADINDVMLTTSLVPDGFVTLYELPLR